MRFQDYTLPQGQTVSSVVVIHGNAVIGGTVTRSVVVVGGNATIESTAVVGAGHELAGLRASSSSAATSRPNRAPRSTARPSQVAGLPPERRAADASRRARPCGPIGVLAGWWQLLFLPIVALVVSALFPRARADGSASASA